MSRQPLSTLDGASFDVAVIGAGINGASTAQQLAAKGYCVVLVESEDYGAGTSSRSSRLMHFGLRYLDRGEPLLNYLKNPGWFLRQCARAKNTMRHRAELVRTMPTRMKPFTMHIPVYRGDYVSPWQVSFALRLINLIGGQERSVTWRKLRREEFRTTPFVASARDHRELQAVYAVEEYQFDWPERLVVDYVMDAVRLGAVCRNHTEAVGFTDDESGWQIQLRDTRGDDEAVVRAKQVINTTGPWIDAVLKGVNRPVPQQIQATKGTHIAVKLPDDHAHQAFAYFNRTGYPFYVFPWRDFFFVGPTETPWTQGDPHSVRATREEIQFLLDEVNYMLPGLDITREQILFHWSGVRPMPHIAGYQGKQNLIPAFNDHGAHGLDNFMSIPGGPLMLHRFTGQRAAQEVAKRLRPSGQPQDPSYASRPFEEDTNSPPVNPAYPTVRLAHLKEMAATEQAAGLQDLLLRRAGLGWTAGNSRECAMQAAIAVAPEFGWDAEAIEQEVARYLDFVDDNFLHAVDP